MKIGKLKIEAPERAEFDGLVRSGSVRRKDAQNEKLAAESRFDLAYNAAHALGLAALRWHGYRSENRYLVFQCLEHTPECRSSSTSVFRKQWSVMYLARRFRKTSFVWISLMCLGFIHIDR